MLSLPSAKEAMRKADDLYSDPRSLSRVRKALELYRKVNKSTHLTVESLWKGSRACAYLSTYSESDDEKSDYAEEGIEYGKRGVKTNPKSGESHYYYALNLGLYADMNRFRALGLLRDMEREALAAIRLAPNFDYAGGYRFLGRLYYEAPAFSIGNRKKGLQFLKKACDIAPHYPPNLLNYGEILLKDDQKNLARKYLSKVLKIKRLREDNKLLPVWKKKARKLLKRI